MSYIHVSDDDVADQIIGISWDTSSNSPALTHIDIDGSSLAQKSHTWFDRHPIYKNIKRCTLTSDGTATFGSNARGDGLTLDGTTGQAMVQIPRTYMRTEKDGDYLNMWISPYAYPGFELNPAFLQRGGTERSQIYVGAYMGTLEYDSSGNKTLVSKTGEQPWTGSTMGEIPFDTGVTEISIGDVVTGATSGKTGTVVDVYVGSGTWGGGDATGNLVVKFPGSDWSNWTNPENIQVSTVTRAATTGVGEALGFTRQGAEDYALAYGSRWGICNIWTWDLLYWLYVTEYCNFNSQSTSVGIGAGVSSKDSGTGFAGENNGADSADSEIGTNGTGTGNGADGETPIVWRGIENFWGNCYQFVIGFDALNAGYRILKRDGTGAIACPLAADQYETSVAAPITDDGYISGLLFEDLTKILVVPNAVAGSNVTYLCDYVYAHDAGETNILRAGGCWLGGATAGAGCRNASSVASYSSRLICARPEFI